jgi:DNA segregation ATPase FtsK/SpoIIIE, S-DNA-T family
VSSPLPNPFSDDRLTQADVFNPELDVPSVHKRASAWVEQAIELARHRQKPDGQAKIAILQSTPGFGKTHVMGRVRHRSHEQGVFVYVPQVEEYGSAVNHVRWHVLRTLFEAPSGQRPLLHELLARLCHDSFRRYFDFLPHTVKEQHQAIRDRLDETSETVMEIVEEAKETAPYLALADSIAARTPLATADVVRALVLGWSPRAVEAWAWLRGDQLDSTQLTELRLPEEPPTASQLLRTLCLLLKPLGRALVVCCDQSEEFLRRPEAFKELSTSLIGWLDTIPNLVLVLSFLKDQWKNLDKAAFASFHDRSQELDLDHLSGPQAVELLRGRLKDWPGARPGESVLWPFREADVLRFAEKHQLSPRGLLQKCKGVLDLWLMKRSDEETGIDGPEEKKPLEELFRQEWAKSLDALRNEKLSPENLQEERLFRAAREALDLLRLGHTAVGGLELLQTQEGALGPQKKYLSLQLKFGVKDSSDAVTVVVALTKLSGGNPLGAFLNAVEQAVADPVVGAVLVRPSAHLSLGPRTEARKKYDGLKNRGKLRSFELAEHRNAFEQMECLLRLLDRAAQKKLQLGQQTVTQDQCRELAVKTTVLAGLDLFDQVCCGWGQTTAVTGATPVQVKVAVTASVPPTGTIAASVSASPAARPTSPAATTTVLPPPPRPPQGDLDWATKLLHAVAAKLIEFGQKVEPLGIEIGPTFARLQFKPLGRTSIGKVRNHASDLRAHIAGIPSVPVIKDHSGSISVDVQRPDRQSVSLESCLSKPPARLDDLPIFPVGVDVTGKPQWLNLADPSTCHVLAAGTTGSGKSEFLKAMLAGLASRLAPDKLRFVLVDPKHVTFNFPGDSPYLLHPVAHTLAEAMPLVQKCFAETEQRYQLLAKRGLEHVGQLSNREALPRIVIVFDEFADLMAARKTRQELEGSLNRIGALARAAGIHLVLATQRPDKDVVTPLLKANLPTRVCLRVEGERNSKIILDEGGGENLLGRGDLFWKHGGGMSRLQGAYVAKEELEKLLRIPAVLSSGPCSQ